MNDNKYNERVEAMIQKEMAHLRNTMGFKGIEEDLRVKAEKNIAEDIKKVGQDLFKSIDDTAKVLNDFDIALDYEVNKYPKIACFETIKPASAPAWWKKMFCIKEGNKQQSDIASLAQQKARKILHELDCEFNVDIDEFDLKIERYLMEELTSFHNRVGEKGLKVK